jgi:prevent-host-death family protein
MISTLNFQEPTVAISAKDVIPVSLASATLSDLVDEVRDGSEKIITTDGEQCAALISAERLAECRRMEEARMRQLLSEDAARALKSLETHGARDAREVMAEIRARRPAEREKNAEAARE